MISLFRKPARFIVLFLVIVFSASVAEAAWSELPARRVLVEVLKDIELNGVSSEAVNALEGFVYTYPNAGVADEALFRLASIYKDKKDFTNASRVYGRLLSEYPASAFTPQAFYGLGYCQYRFGRLGQATDTLRRVSSAPGVTLSLNVRASILLDQIYSVSATFDGVALGDGRERAYAIGAILPLKGDYAEFGDKALKGILLAADVFGGTGEGGVEVYVRDMEGGRESARMVVSELASNNRVKALVGLLFRNTAPEVARRAQQKRIPIISLSQREGLPKAGTYVFRSFMTLSQQARTLARYAFNVKGYTNFAILSPQNSYGRKLSAAFKAEVISLGGVIVGEDSYPPGKSDFSVELKKIFKLETVERMEGRRLIRQSTTGVDVSALFIPDNYGAVAQIAPYLAFYGIKDLLLLGSNGWDSPMLMDIGEGYVEGAVFVDGFFAGSTRESTQEFVQSFKKAYGYEPGLIEAESYDATKLIINNLKGEGVTRRSLRDGLIDGSVYHGATGDVRFDGYGEAEKELFLLTVDNGEIREVSAVSNESVNGEIGFLPVDGLDGESSAPDALKDGESETDSLPILDYLTEPDTNKGPDHDAGVDLDQVIKDLQKTMEKEQTAPTKATEQTPTAEEPEATKPLQPAKKKRKKKKKIDKPFFDDNEDFDADLF